MKLTPEQRQRFVDAAYQVYNNIGPDSGWIDKTPSKSVFVDVIRDHMAMGGQSDLTRDERQLWMTLPLAEKRRIILEVGP